MNDRTAFIVIIVLLVVSTFVIISIRQRGAQERKQRFEEMLRQAERYSGATGDTITIHDNRTDRWIEEMKGESIEVILQKLTDVMEYLASGYGVVSPDGGVDLFPEEYRESTVYRRDIEAILSNRRFRCAYEGLLKTDRKKAADLLTKNIRENLVELRIMFQDYVDAVAKDRYKGTFMAIHGQHYPDAYRPMNHPDYPPTRTARRYAVLSYIVLASLLELREVRPAIEEAIQFAKDEYRLFKSLNVKEAGSFMVVLLVESLYNPSLLLTATLCDPTWNTDKHKLLEAKLVINREVVDWQARSLEHDMPGREGWVPVKPHEYRFKVPYYAGITDAEFDDFFGK
jgi:hypothetical protein